ncbi:hypothetical protein BJF90_43025 [Pseudonocardia sp. CNS-004]|nr:hypothetical protein BJF90_43025 [Pseudonocardia sp. CNS-004]
MVLAEVPLCARHQSSGGELPVADSVPGMVEPEHPALDLEAGCVHVEHGVGRLAGSGRSLTRASS